MGDVDIPEAEPTFYDAVGGAATFRRLVHTFYRGVAEDPDLVRHPHLADQVRRLHDAEQADYLEKA